MTSEELISEINCQEINTMKQIQLTDKELDWVIESIKNDIVEITFKNDWQGMSLMKAEVQAIVDKLEVAYFKD
jgi:hypothetical protein